MELSRELLLGMKGVKCSGKIWALSPSSPLEQSILGQDSFSVLIQECVEHSLVRREWHGAQEEVASSPVLGGTFTFSRRIPLATKGLGGLLAPAHGC